MIRIALSPAEAKRRVPRPHFRRQRAGFWLNLKPPTSTEGALANAEARTGLPTRVAATIRLTRQKEESGGEGQRFRTNDGWKRMGPVAHPLRALGRLVLFQRRRRQRAALLHPGLAAGRLGRRDLADRPQHPRAADTDARPRLDRLLRHGAPEQCAALRAHRLGTAPDRQRPRLHPERDDAAIHRAGRPSPDAGREAHGAQGEPAFSSALPASRR